jgi:hypothetical protein
MMVMRRMRIRIRMENLIRRQFWYPPGGDSSSNPSFAEWNESFESKKFKSDLRNIKKCSWKTKVQIQWKTRRTCRWVVNIIDKRWLNFWFNRHLWSFYTKKETKQNKTKQNGSKQNERESWVRKIKKHFRIWD